MSYEWIRRRKRYLSFRYLFPELMAPWIQLKRALLRVLWFFTHPVDEFFEDLGDLIAWPFVMLATFFAWILRGLQEFFKDLFHGIEACFNYLGRLPVWTGSAIAGTLGIIMTILLFFLQVATFEPVPLSTGMVTPPKHIEQPVPETAWRPELQPQEDFDAFAGTTPPQPAPVPLPEPEPELWRPTPAPTPPAQPGFVLQLSRLSLPFDARERMEVVSKPPAVDPQQGWSHFERLSAKNGWSLTQVERAHKAAHFVSYVTRQGTRNTQVAPNWVKAAASVSPFVQVQNRRQPAVSLVRTAPESAAVGGVLSYELLVSNQGLEPLDSVTIHESISAMDRVMDVQPPANVVDNALVWNLTNLQPREQRRLTIELRPSELVPISGGSVVRVKTGVAAVSRITAPTPKAPPITPAPQQELIVAAPQTEPEPEVQPEPAFEPEPKQERGMILPSFTKQEEPEPETVPQQEEPALTLEPLPEKPAKPAPAIMPLMPLERKTEPSITKVRPLQTIEASADASGVPIFFEMRTPTLVPVEGAVATVFEIRNPGKAELTNLVLLVEVTDELNHERGRILEHRIERLVPGGVYQTRLTTKAVRDGMARVRSNLTSAEELDSTLEAEIKVDIPAKPPTQLSRIDEPLQGAETSTQ